MQSMPEQIGLYQLHAELGQGGMATVYRATDSLRGHPVALKVLPPEFTRNQLLVQRFLREGNSAVKLRHPNVIHVYEAGRADGYYYIAMELAPGGTLADRIRRQGIFSAQETAAILSQAARGLDYAHHLGYLHRDVKPSNIMFGEGDSRGQLRVMLTDFGIVKELGGDQSLFTGTGQTVGTPAYMSPEQARGEEMDQRSDVYSLGVVAYNMLTGRVPFSATSSLALLRKIADDPVPPARQFNPRLAPGVDQVLERVLAKDPERRYPTASAFVQALAQAAGGQPVTTPVVDTGGSRGKTDLGQESGPSPSRLAGQLPVILLSGLSLVLLLALIWLLAGRGDGGTESVSSGGGDAPVLAVLPSETSTASPAAPDEPTAQPTREPTVTAIPTLPPATETPAPPTEAPTMTPMDTPAPSAPTATATGISTSTSTATSVPPTQTPAATQQAQVTGPTLTPTPLIIGEPSRTATPVRTVAPTSTPAVTDTPTPAPTRTATPTPRPGTSSTSAPPSAGGTLTKPAGAGADLLEPANNGLLNSDGSTQFSWRTRYEPPPGYAYELIIWSQSEGSNNFQAGRGYVGETNSSACSREGSGVFNCTVLIKLYDHLQPGWHYWGVAVIQPGYNYQQQFLLSEVRSFEYQRPPSAYPTSPLQCVGAGC